MSDSIPPGQGPVDPRGAFWPPPPPPNVGGPGGGRPPMPPGGMMGPGVPGGWAPPPFPVPPPNWGRPQRRHSFLRLVLALFFLVLLLDLVVMNVAFFVAASNQQGPKQPVLAQHVLLKDGDADQVVAIVPISGLITDTSAAQFDNDLTDIERDKSVKAVVLQVDTPGGSATASDEMLHRLKVFEKRRDDLKVTVSMGAMATSGGYYVSCGGDTIFAEPGTMTANIGVLMPNINVSGLMQKWGIQDATIVGAGGTYKEAGSPLKPEDAQSTAYLQGLVNTTLDQFKTVVVDNRFAGKTPAFASEIFDGRVLIGKAAIARGLVDKIGYLDDAETYAASGAGLSNPRYVRYDPAVNLLSQLLGGQSVNDLGGQSALAGTFDIDGSEIDVRQLAMLLASRPIYLWSGN